MDFIKTAVVLSTLLYLSYGFSRILSMSIDGMLPSEGVVVATIVEILIGLACVFAFLKYRQVEVGKWPFASFPHNHLE